MRSKYLTKVTIFGTTSGPSYLLSFTWHKHRLSSIHVEFYINTVFFVRESKTKTIINKIHTPSIFVRFGLWCLTSLSTIFHIFVRKKLSTKSIRNQFTILTNKILTEVSRESSRSSCLLIKKTVQWRICNKYTKYILYVSFMQIQLKFD